MKKELEKTNMVLNNLEQKLNKEEDLCSSVANLIDLIVETEELIEQLQMVDTKILVIKTRIRSLIRELLEDKEKQKEETINRIKESLMIEKVEYIEKLKRTINYCVENYKLYQQSNYYLKYRTQTKDYSISLLELLI